MQVKSSSFILLWKAFRLDHIACALIKIQNTDKQHATANCYNILITTMIFYFLFFIFKFI